MKATKTLGCTLLLLAAVAGAACGGGQPPPPNDQTTVTVTKPTDSAGPSTAPTTSASGH
jgi:hypothetical protein